MADTTYDKLEKLVHHALVNWNHGSSPETRTTVVMQAIWPEILQMMADQLTGVQRAYEKEIEGLQLDLKGLLEQVDEQ